MVHEKGLLLGPHHVRDVSLNSGDLFRTENVWQDRTTRSLVLSGWLFRPVEKLQGDLRSNCLEVFRVDKRWQDCDESSDWQGRHLLAPDEAKAETKITLTNFLERGMLEEFLGGQLQAAHGICRYKRIHVPGPRVGSAQERKGEKLLCRLAGHEADAEARCDDDMLRSLFRDGVQKGGSCDTARHDEYEHVQWEQAAANYATELLGSDFNPDAVWSCQVSRSSLPAPEHHSGQVLPESDTIPPPIQVADDGTDGDSTEAPPPELAIDLTADSDSSELGHTAPGGRLTAQAIPDFSSEAALRRHFEHLGRTADRYWEESVSRRSKTQTYQTIKGDGSVFRRYTFGDCFAGAGGASRGAVLAGLRVEWAFDFKEEMCQTYQTNFPSTMLARASVNDFIQDPRYGSVVDILHLSPPCQPWSPAYTVENRSNHWNQVAPTFSISEMLRKFKPRIATLEETFGIWDRHRPVLNSVIGQFTDCGYSVRWRAFDLQSFGVPQTRKRLLVIASCPGETLPTFPPYTHAQETGGGPVLPLNFVSNAISGTIPGSWGDHDVHGAYQRARGRNSSSGMKPFDPARTFAKTFTCVGGQNNYHPDGDRYYTIREMAALQTFPIEHTFAGKLSFATYQKQIGNAVPPLAAKTLFDHIRRHLEKVDGFDDGR